MTDGFAALVAGVVLIVAFLAFSALVGLAIAVGSVAYGVIA